MLRLLLLLMLAGCAVPLEGLRVEGVEGWKVGFAHDDPGRGNIVEYVTGEETVQSWTRLVTIQFLEGERRKPLEVMEALRKQIAARCPQVEWSVVEQDRDLGVIYEWRVQGCEGQVDQHELSRLVRGNEGVHRIGYVEKVQRLPDATREEWLAILRRATLVKGEEQTPVVVGP